MISRQAVVALVEEVENKRLNGEIDLTYAPMIKGIKALPSAQPVAKDINVPAKDCISRQAAIDAIMCEPTDAHYPSWYAERLKRLPSAQQERKKGKWIYNSPVTMKCNQCGFVIKDWDWHRFKDCPNCGADMRKDGDGND